MNFARLSDAVMTMSSLPFKLDSCWPSITRRHSLGLRSRTRTCPEAGNTWGRDAGRNGAIAVTMIASRCGSTIGPPADIEYDVEPVGVATMIPSARTRSTI
jgi:hypothetical protein